MHELFLTAIIGEGDCEQAQAILQGFCAMSAKQTVKYLVYFSGPNKPRGFPNLKKFFEEQKTDRQQVRLWTELGQNISRQSYVMQGRYDISVRRHFGPGAE